MSSLFSTQTQCTVPCDQPVLTFGFPTAAAPGNTVTLANGAVVDLVQLGKLIAQFCPSVAAAPTTQAAPTMEVAPAMAAAPTTTQAVVGMAPTAAPFTFRPTPCDGTQVFSTLQPTACAAAQPTVNPVMAAMVGQLMAQAAFLDRFDLRDGPGLDQVMLANLMGL